MAIFIIKEKTQAGPKHRFTRVNLLENNKVRVRDWEDSSADKYLSLKYEDLCSTSGTYEKTRCGFLVTPNTKEAKTDF